MREGGKPRHVWQRLVREEGMEGGERKYFGASSLFRLDDVVATGSSMELLEQRRIRRNISWRRKLLLKNIHQPRF